jgi:excisionase family DNA binding protein
MNTIHTKQPSLLVTIKTASQMLQISERLLFAMTKHGTIRSIRVGSRGVRYDPRDLQKWIDDQKPRAKEGDDE